MLWILVFKMSFQRFTNGHAGRGGRSQLLLLIKSATFKVSGSSVLYCWLTSASMTWFWSQGSLKTWFSFHLSVCMKWLKIALRKDKRCFYKAESIAFSSTFQKDFHFSLFLAAQATHKLLDSHKMSFISLMRQRRSKNVSEAARACHFAYSGKPHSISLGLLQFCPPLISKENSLWFAPLDC